MTTMTRAAAIATLMAIRTAAHQDLTAGKGREYLR